MVGEPFDRVLDVAVAQLGEGFSFGEVDLADVVGETPDVTVEAAHECFESAAGTDCGQLAGVADEHELRAGVGGVVEQPAKVVVVGHTGLVEHHQRAPIEDDAAAVEAPDERCDGVRLDAGVAADGAGGLAGCRRADDSVAVRARGQGARRSRAVVLPDPAMPTTTSRLRFEPQMPATVDR